MSGYVFYYNAIMQRIKSNGARSHMQHDNSLSLEYRKNNCTTILAVMHVIIVIIISYDTNDVDL